MSQGHPMTDDQVANELKKMMAFIRIEALEKAEEIKIKADEEFAIEKSKLVLQGTAEIDAKHKNKLKQASKLQQIFRSNLANKTRICVLNAQQQQLNNLFEQSRQKLFDCSKEKENYQKICKGLIVEGLYMLNESKAVVRARKADYDVINNAITDAKEEYKLKAGQNIEVEIDEGNPVPEYTPGGVIVVGGNGKIAINNTLEERLHLLETYALPALKTILFGENKNRKFCD